jgi:hypothetical protein
LVGPEVIGLVIDPSMVGMHVDILTKLARNSAKCSLNSVVHRGILPELIVLLRRFGDLDDICSVEREHCSAHALTNRDTEIMSLVMGRRRLC